MKKVLLSVSALTLLLTACKKNDDSGQPATQKIVGSWIMTSDQTLVTTNGVNAQPIDNFINESSCTKDDLYNYTANGMFSNTEGATKCRTADPDTIGKGMYSLYSNDTRLIYRAENGAPLDTFDIVELSGSTMRLKKDVTLSGSGVTVVSSNQLAFSKK
ncbi:MAG: hypothetical protein EOP52_02860 [Sphingobacteriales bacterium]|nr:MAG: hypothetical protein EOP52_02860 [Sphingobacteriales bacterium]